MAAAACRQAFTFMGSLRKLLPPFLGLCLVSLRSNFPDETLMWPKIVIDLNKFIGWDPFYSQEQGQEDRCPGLPLSTHPMAQDLLLDLDWSPASPSNPPGSAAVLEALVPLFCVLGL